VSARNNPAHGGRESNQLARQFEKRVGWDGTVTIIGNIAGLSCQVEEKRAWRARSRSRKRSFGELAPEGKNPPAKKGCGL